MNSAAAEQIWCCQITLISSPTSLNLSRPPNPPTHRASQPTQLCATLCHKEHKSKYATPLRPHSLRTPSLVATMTPPSTHDDTRLERLMEHIAHLQVATLQPQIFASRLRQNPADLTLFNSVLPILLASDRFELSASLAQVVQNFQQPDIAITSICNAATLAEASFLYALRDDCIPSSLCRLKTNVAYASQILGWSHICTVSALQICLKNSPAFLPSAGSSSSPPNASLPPNQCNEFKNWFSTFTRNSTTTVNEIMHNVDSFIQHRFDSNFYSRLLDFNLEQQQILTARIAATFGANWKETSALIPSLKRNTFLFLLTQYALSRNEQIDWPAVSIAYACLLSQCTLQNDERVWWSSLHVVLSDLYSTHLIIQSRAMLLIPFLLTQQCPAVDYLIPFLHLLSAVEDDFAVYVVLSLLRSFLHSTFDNHNVLQYLSSCLPLPEPVFQHIADTLNLPQHRATSTAGHEPSILSMPQSD